MQRPVGRSEVTLPSPGEEQSRRAATGGLIDTIGRMWNRHDKVIRYYMFISNAGLSMRDVAQHFNELLKIFRTH